MLIRDDLQLACSASLNAELFNEIVNIGNGTVTIKMYPTRDVDPETCGLQSYTTVAVAYETTGSSDCNDNLVPDECDVSGDVDGNGVLDLGDYASAVTCLSGPCDHPACDPPLYSDICCSIADFDDDGDYDLQDFSVFQRKMGGGGP